MFQYCTVLYDMFRQKVWTYSMWFEWYTTMDLYTVLYSTVVYHVMLQTILVSLFLRPSRTQKPSFGVACRHFEDRGETVLGSCLPCFYLFNIVVWSTMFAFGFKVFLVSCIEQYCSVFFWKPIQNNAVRIWMNIWDIWHRLYIQYCMWTLVDRTYGFPTMDGCTVLYSNVL